MWVGASRQIFVSQAALIVYLSLPIFNVFFQFFLNSHQQALLCWRSTFVHGEAILALLKIKCLCLLSLS